MKKRPWFKADGLLLLTAIIWGLAFAAQRMGMDYIGPFAYNGLRFAIGALCMAPFALRASRARARTAATKAQTANVGAPTADAGAPPMKSAEKALWSAAAGLVLFAGSSLQQIGLVETTAGNAGFITCLYVVIVPLLGVLGGKKAGLRIWMGAALALTGLYLLSIRNGFRMAPGDILVLVGAFFWAFHIIIVGRLARVMDPSELGFGQYTVCAALSLISAVAFEPAPFAGTMAAAIPILYGGFLSIGVAFTLQIVAQKTAHPAHASIILSMEALFAALGGAVILGETIDRRTALGGALMLAGMVISQTIKPEPAPASRYPQSTRSGS